MSSTNIPRQDILSKFKEVLSELDWANTIAEEDVKAGLREALPEISEADLKNIRVHPTTVSTHILGERAVDTDVPEDPSTPFTIRIKTTIEPERLIFYGTATSECLLNDLPETVQHLILGNSAPLAGNGISTGYIAISMDQAAAVKEFNIVHDPVADPRLGIDFSEDNTVFATVSLRIDHSNLESDFSTAVFW